MFRLSVCAAALAACLPSAALADQLVNGREVYQQYCSGCHGEGGRGDGPAAALMTVPMPDLTALSARYGGVFPLAEVVRRIDGREEVRAHGDPMPIFGALLTGGSAAVDAPDGSPITTKAAVLAIADYLAALQE